MKDKKKNVVVADDDPDVRFFFASVLEDAGFDVRTADDGVKAMELVRAAPPDLISLDLVMPERSGIRVIHELRRDPELARIPLIIVTGHARDKTVRANLDEALQQSSLSSSGVCLEKPVTKEVYLRRVKQALGMDGGEDPEETRLQELKKRAQHLIAHADTRALEGLVSRMEKRAPRRGTVLVVDDDPDIRAFLTTVLYDLGFDVECQGDGQDVPSMARACRPKLILLDIAMPKVSGIRAYRDLRKDNELAHIPIIVVTGLREDFQSFLEKRKLVPPPEGYVAKPFDAPTIIAAIEEAVG